jgi:TRAP-type C4-dicarboxylate transport system permease small subunit
MRQPGSNLFLFRLCGEGLLPPHDSLPGGAHVSILKRLDENLEKSLMVCLLGAMCVLIFLQILFRYLLNMPLAWTEEISRYCYVWLIYLGASYAVKKRRHLKVDAVLLLFKARGRFVLMTISNLLFMLFCVVIAYYGTDIVYMMQFVRVQESPAVGIPMSVVYAAVPVGTVLMIIRLTQDTLLLIREYRERKDDVDTKALLQRQINEEMNIN